MSYAGRPNDPNEVAAALQGRQAPPQGAQPQQPPTPPGAQNGGLAQLAQAYARCEQTGNCTPQDLQVLQQGLPHLAQMVQNIQKIIQVAGQRQQGAQPGAQPQ